jgi:hypothetical protein
MRVNFELSPEEYVSSLYRVILKRKPDDSGLFEKVSELREHGDYTRILRTFLNSPEFRDVELRRRAYLRQGDTLTIGLKRPSEDPPTIWQVEPKPSGPSGAASSRHVNNAAC